jgi:hypothetical protein
MNKKMRKYKKTVLNILVVIIGIVAYALGLLSLSSCNDRLGVKQNFDFEVTHLPYKSADVQLYEVIEIRFAIKSIEGAYNGTKYYLRYFQFTGSGNLTDERGIPFYLNDTYEVPNKTFRLYFTPQNGQQHSLTIVFSDSWGHEKSVDIDVSLIEETVDTKN